MTDETEQPQPRTPSRVEIEDRERVFDRFFAIDRYTLRRECYTGGMSDRMERLVFERGDAAAVLPYDRQTDQLLLVEQFRLPAFVRHEPGWLWELIAGTSEPERTLEEVARNEALEEAGYRLGPLRHLLTIFPSPGGSTERVAIYLADLAEAERVGSGGGLSESGEDIRVGSFRLDQALDMIRRGEIVDAKTVIALQHLALYPDASA